ncbi:hypothetical protein, partial [Ilumatobacter sp.]|uniref:hypothetical protein n=1 Tax=Ilumatobacter sp. TaxID=1967498 RepID=UPI003C5EF7CE
ANGPIEVSTFGPATARFGDASGPVVWNRAANGTWLQGWSSTGTTPDGRIELSSGGGLVWNPALVGSIASQAAIVMAVAACAWLRRSDIRRAIVGR